MTLQVTVKNEDNAGRVAEVVEEEYRIGSLAPERTVKTRLSAGESRSFHVHASKRLIVSEDPDSLR